MPALRKFLKRPETYLLALGIFAGATAVDAVRAPRDQVTVRVFMASVRGYQRWGRPMLANRVVCRYRPSCSEYSISAVRRFGILRGLKLSILRIQSCTRRVALGTSDPVPQV